MVLFNRICLFVSENQGNKDEIIQKLSYVYSRHVHRSVTEVASRQTLTWEPHGLASENIT